MRMIIKDRFHIYNTRRPHFSCYMNTQDRVHQEIKTRTYKTKNPANICLQD